MITKIVITGGPCAGKTTAMSRIQEYFGRLGYRVLFVPETATELIMGGISPVNCSSAAEFQKCLMKLQLQKEAVFERAASGMKDENILIVCDRGALDNKAYMSQADFDEVLQERNISEVSLRDGYDAVFHLVTAANGAEECYTTANNAARTETPQQARELDEKLIAAWTGHPHLRVIDNSTDFSEKIGRLLAEISSFLGVPEPYEIERKFLIEYPDTAWLESLPNCERVEIIQTYLLSREGEETRVRQRGANGSFTYYKTTKRKISDVRRVEVESRLTQNEYLAELLNADTSAHPIRKTRYCLAWNSQYFEVDVYPFWNDKAIAEIELQDEAEQIVFPEQLKVIREVTDDPAYKNASLARSLP